MSVRDGDAVLDVIAEHGKALRGPWSAWDGLTDAIRTLLGDARRQGAAAERRRLASHFDREALGRWVRDVWITWAREQPEPKPSWLAPWEALTEPEREVDRRIGEELATAGAADMEALERSIEQRGHREGQRKCAAELLALMGRTGGRPFPNELEALADQWVRVQTREAE